MMNFSPSPTCVWNKRCAILVTNIADRYLVVEVQCF